MHALNGAELSIVRLPALKDEARDSGLAFPVIARDQFLIDGWWIGSEFNIGDPVRLVGPWYGHTRTPQLINRAGSIALGTIDPVQFRGRATRVYLVDGTVTRGMSGGPAYLTRGAGWAENALSGVIFGYWPMESDAITAREPSTEETPEQRARRRLLEEVAHLNTQLAIVEPVHEIGELLIREGWPPPPAR